MVSQWPMDRLVRTLEQENGEVLVVPAEGGLERSLGKFEGITWGNLKVPGPNIAWTPDSNYLIVSGRDQPDTPIRLFRVSIRDGGRTPVLEPASGILGDAGPSISPNGKRIAFHRFVAMGSGEIRVAPVGTEFLGAGRSIAITKGKFNSNPVWINNTELVFYGYREGDFQLFRVAADGLGTPSPVLGGTTGHTLAYSAAAKRLAFTQDRATGDLWRVALRGPGSAVGPPSGLIRSSRQDVVPEYSPDGGWIAFTSNRSGYPNIWICDREGGHCRQVSYLEGSITGPSTWAPDTKRVAFSSNTTGAGDIYTIDAAGSGAAPRNFTADTFGTREELTTPTRQKLTTNRPRVRCLSDEHGLVALGLAARLKRSAPNFIQRLTRLRRG